MLFILSQVRGEIGKINTELNVGEARGDLRPWARKAIERLRGDSPGLILRYNPKLGKTIMSSGRTNVSLSRLCPSVGGVQAIAR